MLRKELIKHCPINVFSTVCCFLNPLALDNNNYKYANHIYLTDDSFLFIDIDNHNSKIARKIKKAMLSDGRYELWKEVDSGNGIHQYYFDNQPILYKDPLRRMQYQLNLREKIVNNFKNLGLEFDYKCLTDLSRISRVIGTPNDGDINKICSEIHSYKGLQRRKPMKGGAEQKLPPTSRHNILQGVARRPPTPALMKFTDAAIYGAKDLFIPYLCISRSKYYIEKLQQLSLSYKLGTMYIFESERYIHVFSLKSVSKNRYKKILRASGASNLNEFLKYGHSWIRVSSLLDKDYNIIENRIKFLNQINHSSIYLPGDYSRPHYNLLKMWNIRPADNLHLIGKELNPCFLAYRKEAI